MASDQLELFSITNPCVGVCESNQRGYCKGCLRSREERFNWHAKSEAERRDILQRLARRRARLRASTPASEQQEPPTNLNLPGFADE